MHKKSPKFLNLWQIRFPVTAIVSIAHRISGVFLFICLPVYLCYLNRSLISAQEFSQIVHQTHHWGCLLLNILAGWALGYHILAGGRHLLMDLGIGESLCAARASAFTVWGLFVFWALYWACRLMGGY